MDFEKTSKILFPQLIGNWHCTRGTEKSACLFLGSGFQDVPKGVYCNESVHQTLAYFSHQFIFVSCGVSSSHSCRSIASKNDQGPDTSFCFWNAQVIHLWMSLCPSTLEPRKLMKFWVILGGESWRFNHCLQETVFPATWPRWQWCFDQAGQGGECIEKMTPGGKYDDYPLAIKHGTQKSAMYLYIYISIYIYIWWPPPVPTLSVPLPVFTVFFAYFGVYIFLPFCRRS